MEVLVRNLSPQPLNPLSPFGWCNSKVQGRWCFAAWGSGCSRSSRPQHGEQGTRHKEPQMGWACLLQSWGKQGRKGQKGEGPQDGLCIRFCSPERAADEVVPGEARTFRTFSPSGAPGPERTIRFLCWRSTLNSALTCVSLTVACKRPPVIWFYFLKVKSHTVPLF